MADSSAPGLMHRVRNRLGRFTARRDLPAGPPATGAGQGLDPFAQLIRDPARWNDPFDLYEQMRRQAPVYVRPAVQQDAAFPPVIATGYDAVSTVLKDERFRVEVRTDHPDTLGLSPAAILKNNPPRHGELRTLMGKGFGPRHIARLSDLIHQECDRLLDRAMERDSFDAVQDYALPLAVFVIGYILGIPDQYHARLQRLGNDVSRILDPFLPPEQRERSIAAAQEMQAYFRELVASRRQEPGDDLLSTLVQSTAHPPHLTEDEVEANAQFTLLAGFETTVGMIGNGFEIFADRPDLWQAMQDEPDSVPTAVEEVLRLQSPVQIVRRLANEDLEIEGCRIVADSTVFAVLGAANRDPAMFADPTVFDLHRDNANRQLAFVVGAHHCLGSALARLEGQLAFRRALERLPQLRRAAPSVRRPHLVARGMVEVPLVSRP